MTEFNTGVQQDEKLEELEELSESIEMEEEVVNEQQLKIEKLEQEVQILRTKIDEKEKQEKFLQNEQKQLEAARKLIEQKLAENEKVAATLLERQLDLQKRESDEKINFAHFKLTELDRMKTELEKGLEAKRTEIERQKVELEKSLEKKRKEIELASEQLEQDIVKRKDIAEKEIAKLRGERLKELDAEYALEHRAVQERLLNYKKEIEAIINEKQVHLTAAIADMQRERQQFENEKRTIEQKDQELRSKELDLVNRESDLRMDQDILRQEQQSLQARVERECQALIQEKQLESEQLREFQRSLTERVRLLETELNKRDQSMLRLGNRTADDLLHEIEVAKKEIYDLRAELQNRPGEETFVMLEERSRKFEELQSLYTEAQRKLQKLELAEHRFEMSVAQLQMERQKYEMELKRREVIELQLKKYEDDINRLKKLHEQSEENGARIGVIEEPYFQIEKTMNTAGLTEEDWLSNIEQLCERSGMKFNRRLLLAFHTALKTSEYSPLTVLAGVSGTGKSELPRLYSRFGGLYYLSLPVQPDWDSPQSLFGYFNSVDNRFNATPLIRSMVQFQQEVPENLDMSSLKDSVLLVLLDEMNLAHVELYFSELLSKLETRRGEKNAVYLDVDLGAGMDKYKVALSPNVLWVGTMNEDETTKSLSDKVIDRGNLISFPRPMKFEDRKTKYLADPEAKLPFSVWKSWIDQQVNIDEEIVPYKEALEEINSYLEVVGRALGHRVWQSVKNYIGNHPLVISAKKKEDEELLTSAIRGAFEEAIVHKVMPKLRGIEVEGLANTQCLMPIRNKLLEIAPGLVTDFDLAISNAYGVFIWRSAKYLEASEQAQMEQQLADEQSNVEI